MVRDALALPAEQLTVTLTPQDLPFEQLSQLEPVSGYLGHDRAYQALEFAAMLANQGSNVFIIGEPGTGRFSLTKHFFAQLAADANSGDDWLYVPNLEHPRAPLYIRMHAGAGNLFLEHIDQFIDQLLATFPAAFEHPGYQRQRARIERQFNQRYETALACVERRASELGFSMLSDEGGVAFTPVVEGKPLDESEFGALDDTEKDRLQQAISGLEELLSEQLLELPQWRREAAEQQHKLERDTARQALKPLLKQLEHRYSSDIGVLRYLRSIKHHLPRVICDQLIEFHAIEQQDLAARRAMLAEIYRPNLLIDNLVDQGAPVIYEPQPSYSNLFGRIEYQVSQGGYQTNHSLIRPGALHRANGGYLLLDAEKLLHDPVAWHSLKLALKTQQIIMGQPAGYPADTSGIITVSLDPQPIPLTVKVAIVGERETYYLLQQMDPDFDVLFRILADCDSHVPRTPETTLYLARLLRTHAEQASIPDATPGAVQQFVLFSSRLAQDKAKLSTQISALYQLLEEADVFRRQQKAVKVERVHVIQARQAAHQRHGRLRAQLLSDITQGLVRIATDGTTIGQVNGLTVVEFGSAPFGLPARISATAYPGSSGVVDIERETTLGQPIHSKGVLLLTGFLGHRYARQIPLSLSANIAFEQSYGQIEGDSASLAEACALLSALIQAPLRQDLALTGAINQYGEIHAVGGVNEKIEGFFALCQARGLTGRQGVMIPQSNIRNLVLDQTVVNAVANGEFAVYAVTHIDQALSLLAGEAAGAWQEQQFEPGSLNARIVCRLEQLARRTSNHQR